MPGRLAIVWDARLIEAQAFTVDLPQAAESLPISIPTDSTVVPDQPTVPDDVRDLAVRCSMDNGGKFTEAWLVSIGQGQKEARRLQAAWADQGWIFQNPRLKRAWCLSPSLRQQLDLAPLAGEPDEPDGRDELDEVGEPPLQA